MEEGKHTISERKIIIKHLYLVRGKYLLKERIPWEENSLHRVHGREGISPLLHVRKDKSYMFPKCIWEASREVFLQMTVICQNKQVIYLTSHLLVRHLPCAATTRVHRDELWGQTHVCSQKLRDTCE